MYKQDSPQDSRQNIADEPEPLDLPAAFADWLTEPIVPAGATMPVSFAPEDWELEQYQLRHVGESGR